MSNTDGGAADGEQVGGPLAYELVLPLEPAAAIQRFGRAVEASYHVAALVNKVVNPDADQRGLAFGGSALVPTRVTQARYGSPVFVEILQGLQPGGTLVQAATGLGVIVGVVSAAAIAPAKITRAYLDNMKVKRELDAGKQAQPAAAQPQPEGIEGDDQQTAAISSAVDTTAGSDDSERADVPSDTLVMTSGPATAHICEYLLTVLQDDGSAQFATIAAVLRKAKEDGDNGRMTNEVVAAAELFAFAQAGGTVNIRGNGAA